MALEHSYRFLIDFIIERFIDGGVIEFTFSLHQSNQLMSDLVKLFRSSARFVARCLLEDDSQLNSTLSIDRSQEPIVAFDEACAKHLICLDAIRDRLYEELNVCRWNQTLLVKRQSYAMASFYFCTLKIIRAMVANRAESAQFYHECLHLLDMGLLYSPPVCNNLLATLAKMIHQRLTTIDPIRLDDDCVESQNDLVGPTIDLGKQVPIKLNLDPFLFKRSYLDEQKPVLIRNAINDWPALHKWTLQHLLDTCGARLVPIELGHKYTDDDWGQRVMSFRHFIAEHLCRSRDCTEPIGYCAQFELFDRIIELADDFRQPDYCAVSDSSNEVHVNAWFGPAGTVSPLHHDPKHNVFAQVRGRKYVRLYSPRLAENESIYVCESDFLDNTSQVNVENVDYEKYPLFPRHYLECVLEPGDLLFIPRHYWHYVRSLSLSFSISFWFD